MSLAQQQQIGRPMGERDMALGRRVGYARVDDTDSDGTAQIEALEAAGCQQVFSDLSSAGVNARHPALTQCLEMLQPGDALIVWKLDRLGRGLRDLVKLLDTLRDRGVMFLSLAEGIDTSLPSGRAAWQMIAVLAHLERSLSTERTKAGMRNARSKGVRLGRRPKLNPYQVSRARQLVQAGESVPSVAKLLNVDRSTIYRLLGTREVRELR